MNLVLAALSAGEHGAAGRFDGDRANGEFFVELEVPANPGDRTARPHAGDEDVDLALGIDEDFGAGGFDVDCGVRGISELLGHVEGRVGREFFGLGDRPGHAIGPRSEDEVGSKRLEHHPTFDRHGVGHGEGQRVPFCRADEGERDSGVSAGGFHHVHAGFQSARFFGIPDHRRADAALDAVSGIAAFYFGQNGGPGMLGNAIDSHQRGSANRFGVVLINRHGANILPGGSRAGC